MKFKATFTGREVGAIGKFYKISTVVTGDNEDQARLKLYNRYEHITGLTLKEKPYTKAERRSRELQRHHNAISQLLTICEISGNPVKVSNKLREIEHFAHKSALDYCNGDNGITTDKWGELSKEYRDQVQNLFCGKLKGLRINGDARGYALKIDDQTMRNEYKEVGLQKDWGGYGLLSPEITGD